MEAGAKKWRNYPFISLSTCAVALRFVACDPVCRCCAWDEQVKKEKKSTAHRSRK